jgi:hypothetical protein
MKQFKQYTNFHLIWYQDNQKSLMNTLTKTNTFLRSWSGKSHAILQTFIRDKSVSNIYCKEKWNTLCPINFFCMFYSVWDNYTIWRKNVRIFMLCMQCLTGLHEQPSISEFQFQCQIFPWWVGTCHHGMARPQVVDGGMASNMEGSCECIE